jgi:hypothetical protein
MTKNPQGEAAAGPATPCRGRPSGTPGKPRSLPRTDWPASDNLGWAAACQPSQRLKRGGAAAHLALVSRTDIANRYGLFLDFLRRLGRLDPPGAP